MSNIALMEQERDTNFLVASELLRKGSCRGSRDLKRLSSLIPKLHHLFSTKSLEEAVLHLSQILALPLVHGLAMTQGL